MGWAFLICQFQAALDTVNSLRQCVDCQHLTRLIA